MRPAQRSLMNHLSRGALPATLTVSLLAITACVGACSVTSKAPTDDLQAAVPFPFPPTQSGVVESTDAKTLDQELEKRLQTESGEAIKVFVRYRQAQLWANSNSDLACERYLEASSQPKFPLKDVAHLRAMELCKAGKGNFPATANVTQNATESWLKEDLIRAALGRAEKTKDQAAEMRLLVEASRYDSLQSDKVKKLERAIQLARSLNDTAFADSTMERLKNVAPRFRTDAKPDQYIQVAGDFRQVRKFAKAREWYLKAVESTQLDDGDKLQALDGIRLSYKLEKDTPNYLQATQSYADFAHKRLLDKAKGRLNKEKRGLLARYLDTQILLARAVWTEGSPRQARDILLKAERDVNRRISVAPSALIRARIEEEAGRFEQAVKILSAISEKKIQDRSLLSRIVWFRAWDLKKLGRNEEAIALFERAIQLEQSPTLLARNHFWLGRTYAHVGQEEKAKVEFEWLIENDPLGYYGLLSYRELKRPLTSLGVNMAAKSNPPPLKVEGQIQAASNEALTPQEKLTFEWLMAVNEADLARRYLDQVNAARSSALNEEQRFSLLTLYARTGQFHTLFNRVIELPAPTRRKLIESRPELYFPRPWKHLVDAAARKFEVPQELIYSIMRQESSFIPSARSHADAFGLMQLIPEVARVAGKRAELMIDHHEDLYRPDVNIPLGAAFLRDLLDRWKDKFVPVVASYNASEKAISGWLKTRFRGDVLEFIEDVPYDETKTYLKLVMRNFVFYSRLNTGSQEQVAELPFPEWCLADLQDIKP